MKVKLVFIFLFSFIFILIFHNWFAAKDIIGGDWPYFFPQRLAQTTILPPAWNTILINGLGGVSPLYSLQAYHQFTISVSNIFHIPWVFVYKILWFGLFLSLSIFSSIFLIKSIFPKAHLALQLLCSLIYTTNTYILMVVGGGQMGVSLSYSLSPFVLGLFIRLIESCASKEKIQTCLRLSLITGTVFALQIILDPRISYISVIAIILYALIQIKKLFSTFSKSIIFVGFIPLVTVFLLNIFWILPTILFHYNPATSLGSAYTDIGAFKFFSFADFSHSFALLHPNWPENIFGKIYFLYPEFLVLPLIAFSSLLFFKKEKNKNFIVFFVLLGLVGSFLAKGANDPFGVINNWMFVHVHGFVLFRDPTKFYVLIVLSYAFLIPFSLEKIAEKFFQKNALPILILVFISFWLYLIRPAVTGNLNGTFDLHSIPPEYIKLGSFIGNQHDFFRTLWVPRQQRFSFVSDDHPAIEAQPLFNSTNSAEVIQAMQQKNTQKYLQSLDIRYIVVPYDSLGELFVKDRKYDNQQYVDIVSALRKLSWLHEIRGFGRIVVFQIFDTKPHFWLTNMGNVSSKMISPDRYYLQLSTQKPTKLIFVESFSQYWVAYLDNKKIFSQKTQDGFNSFSIPRGNYKLTIYFKEEQFFLLGWILSGISFVAILIAVFLLK